MLMARKPSDLVLQPNKIGIREQLCWSCMNACGGCSWSLDFIPVKGWKALKSSHESYRILDCPKFIRG